ncbi:PepSY domain-containing protein [Solitalea sp. MAHUQ-68]|uniref:PepSY domain-containing protein n=1 Tax=Solitalea agri TaxID=2953739 RepID=A0A9X2F7R1_9SPHI|nr:PepSY domain-containing protein [Solitalea agri]
MWTISGIMHPLMSSFKPKIKNQFLISKTIDLSKVNVSLDSALLKNKILSISNFRLIELDGNVYYQIAKKGQAELVYINAADASINHKGAELYAGKIASQLLGDSTATIQTISLVKQFDEEYLEINRLLPVYKVVFDRADGIRLYVDPSSDRLGLAVENNRAMFSSLFRNFHSWKFLDHFGSFRLVALCLLCLAAFVATLMGIYIAFITKSKKGNTGNSAVKYRKLHRRIAIVVSITSLMFTFSGAYHAFAKFKPDTRQQYFIEEDYKATELNFKPNSLSKQYDVKNISLIKINNTVFLQITCSSQKGFTKEECCEKMGVAAAKFGMNMKSPMPMVRYLSLPNLQVLPNGDQQYARFMASVFSKQTDENIISVTPVTEFKGEYGFVNKRLPVYKVQYKMNNNERWYVETSSGKLAAKINDIDLREGLSFAMLHKFHFADELGKTSRDVLTIIAALGNLLAAIAGIILLAIWFRKKKTSVKTFAKQ